MTLSGVELIASGYEWTCPKCETDNATIELVDKVTCAYCDTDYIVDSFEHAYKG